jgi:mannose/fructose/N-acetylgalactosamine-specific phosphotransferase system component IID
MAEHLSSLTIWRLVWRSFFIQAFWNYHNLQGSGFLFIVELLFGASKTNRMKHGDFYNGHPYFVGIPAGVVAKFRDDPQAMENIQAFRESIISPLGAIGDTLFWTNIRPLALLFPVWLYLLHMPVYVVLSAILASLFIYNLYQVYIRWWAFREGLALGLHVCREFNMRRFTRVISYSQKGLVFTYSLMFLLIGWQMAEKSLIEGLTLFVLIIIMVLLRRWLRNPVLLILLAILLIWITGRLVVHA